MKYTTLLALSSFIVFQGYAVGHQAGWVEGRRCITNYGVPTQAEVKEYITTPNLEKAVLDGKITNEMVLDDLYNASMGVKKVSENQKKAFIERHVKVQEVFFIL